MLKKIFVIMMVLNLVFISNISGIAKANTEDPRKDSIVELEGLEKLEASEDENAISPQALPDSYKAIVIVAFVGAAVESITTNLYSSAMNWLKDNAKPEGNEYGSCSAVKLGGETFVHTDLNNRVGDGMPNRANIVLGLQKALNRNGFSAGTNDGVWGTNTKSALIAAQKKHGVPADGVAGKDTYATFSSLKKQGCIK